MGTEQNRDDTYNVWMTRDEYQILSRSTNDWEHEITIRLMGDCCLRRAEVLDVCPAHISRYTDGRHYRLEVVGGKDTTGEFDNGNESKTLYSTANGLSSSVQSHPGNRVWNPAASAASRSSIPAPSSVW